MTPCLQPQKKSILRETSVTSYLYLKSICCNIPYLLSLLTWHTCISSMFNVGGQIYLPRSEAICPEGVSEKSLPGGLSGRTLYLGIPPQGTSIGHGYPKMTPYTVLVSCPYPDFPPPLPWGGGGVAVGWPRRVQLHAVTANGLRATRPPG